MFDRGVDGVDRTIDLLRQNSVVPLTNDIVKAGDAEIIAVTALLNPVDTAPTMSIPNEIAHAGDLLRSDSDAELRVVYVHGGEEYLALPSSSWTATAERFIDAGADAVVFVHSHVPGDVLLYKGKPIFRGLGNFLFDQTDTVPTSTAKIVRLRKENGVVRFSSSIIH
jgi:poly-gamma-glutamate capsule biosynthesis protein CapA/YwtB (metallophosphatase superfamily)